MEQLVLKVDGMDCSACEQRIQRALGRLEGVRSAVADHRDGEVRVVFDPQQTPEPTIRDCVVQAGYEITDENRHQH